MTKQIILHVPYHSVVDLITNSSSELFIIRAKPKDETAKILLDVLRENGSSSSSSYYNSSIETWADFFYKDEYIIPENFNTEDLYVANVDNCDTYLQDILRRVFEVVTLEYKDE